MKGPSSPRWKGGRTIHTNGYVLVWVGRSFKNPKGYEYEHRLIAARTLGRPLLRNEEVHHLDGDKLNNDAANLVVVTRAKHALLQLPNEPNVIVDCACGCGTRFAQFDGDGRFRAFRPGHHPRARTYCFRGHPFSEENTYITPSGHRRCRACVRRREEAAHA